MDDAERWAEPWYALAALTLTNLLFLAAALRALQFGRHVRAALYAGTVLASGFYHWCKPANGTCVLPYRALWFLDFELALVMLPTTFLFLIPFGAISAWHADEAAAGGGSGGGAALPRVHVAGAPRVRPGRARSDQTHVEAILIVLNLAAIALYLLLAGEPPLAALVALTAANAALVPANWWWLWRAYGLRPEFDWTDLVIAVVLAALGIPLYFASHAVAPAHYWVLHSLWHALIAAGQFYLMETRSRTHSGLWQLAPWPEPAQRHLPGAAPELPEPWGLRGRSLSPFVPLSPPVPLAAARPAAQR